MKDIRVHFNLPYISHRGEVWERQIQSLRCILGAVSREEVLTEESLSTFLVEAEHVLNNRPLCLVYGDPEQIDVLTPNNLLLLRPQPESLENLLKFGLATCVVGSRDN